jgi:hypothetical protein
MGFLSDITGGLFGGSDDTGIKEQQKANERSQAYIQQQTGQARGDASQLYQQGDYARNLGINLAMALMGQALPQQYGMLQRGQADYQNAILGNPDGSLASLTNQPFQYMPGGLPQSTPMQLPSFGQTWNFSAPQGNAQGGAQGGGQGGDQNQMVMNQLSQMLGGMFR